MRLAILFCLILSIVCIYAQTPVQKVFSDKMHYSIQYPLEKGWRAFYLYQRENNSVEQILEQTVLRNDDGAYITVSGWKSHPNLDLKYWMSMMQDSLKLDTTPGKEINVTTENLPGLHYTYLTENGQAYNSQMVFFKNMSYVFCVAYLERDAGRANEVYQEILKTFSFQKVGSPIPHSSTNEKTESRVYTCGDQNDVCKCNMDNPYPCCDNGSNCTWWAWEKACCVWAIGLPSPWRNAKYWAGDLASHGYSVSSSPRVNTIACRDIGTYGHVAWVIAVDGSRVKVSEMNCCTGCNYGVREYWYDASYFTGGYISKP